MRRPRNKAGFTLIELLVVVAILGTMVTVGVTGLRSGQQAARIKGASRDIFAMIRRARSAALVMQQPTVLTYSEKMSDDEPSARIEIASAKVFSSRTSGEVITLSGEPVKRTEADTATTETTTRKSTAATSETEATAAAQESGDALEDILFAPLDDNLLQGIRIKVTMGDELLEATATTVRKSSISVFSTSDYLKNRYADSKKSAAATTAAASETTATERDKTAATVELQQETSVVWETNGRVDPHKIWVYRVGTQPTDGYLISVDRFGGVKVLNGDGTGDDD